MGILRHETISVDAFNRIRVSNPVTVFESQFQYSLQPYLWQTSVTGSAGAVHLPNESSVQLQVGTGSLDRCVRQTYQYMRYQPGKSQMIILTGVLGSPKANVIQQLGYFDDRNGVFFRQTATGPALVLRSFTSGQVSDNVVSQINWNLDVLKVDSNRSPSGIGVDLALAQIFFFDLEWLGVGQIRCGFIFDGQVRYCHVFSHSNLLTGTYMTTANLPVRYEIHNLATAASATTMKQICSTVVSEGGFDIERGYSFSVNRSTSTVSVTTRRPILSIRPARTFGDSSEINRAHVVPQSYEIYVNNAQNIFYEVVYGGTLTGAAWSQVASGSSTVEVDVAATAIVSGSVVDSGYINQNTARVMTSLLDTRLPFTRDIYGDNHHTLTLVCESLAASAQMLGELHWKEIY